MQIKRREEKDLRGAEKQHLAQIASLESDIAKLDKKLERSRESYETMKNNYSSQCEETEKLRSLVAETRRVSAIKMRIDIVLTVSHLYRRIERRKKQLKRMASKCFNTSETAKRCKESSTSLKPSWM